MREILNIITPVTRPQNLARVAESIMPLTNELEVRWLVMPDPPDFYGNKQRNRALRMLRPEGWLYFLDDDTIMHENFLPAFRAVVESGRDVGLICQEFKNRQNRNNPWAYHTVGCVDTGNLVVKAALGVKHEWVETEIGADWHYINRIINEHYKGEFPFITPISGSYYNYLRPSDVWSYVPFGGVIIECGAHRGEDTVKLAERARWVYAFEPDVKNIADLRVNTKAHVNVFVIPKAVADKDGLRDWFEANNTQSSSLLPATEHHYNAYAHVTFSGYTGTKVQVTTVDSLSLARVDFIWCDVQGATALLIAGARETLKRSRYFYCEVADVSYYEGEPTRSDMLALLGDGWVLKEQWDCDSLYENTLLM